MFSLSLQTSKVVIDHIESRKAKKLGTQHDLLLQCTGLKDTVTSVMNSIRQNNSVADVWCENEKLVSKQGLSDINIDFSVSYLVTLLI